MKRVLVFGMTENPGGVESFILGYYRNIDRSRIQFDFLCNSYEPVAYEDELISLGGRTFHITARSKDRALYNKELKEVFEKHSTEWDAIWVNVSSLANIDYLKIAKKHGIKKRIIHSHNSQNMDNRLRGLLHKWNRSQVAKYATDFWACSDAAAKWFYNDSLIQKAVIIHNAIDVKSVAFDEEKRNAVRSGLGIAPDEFVIGNVGRLHFQKNQKFMLDIFGCFIKDEPDSRLVMVGAGEDEKALKEKSQRAGLDDKVIFAGLQQDIQAWLSAFDLFLFPSVFEGLSIAALEAQANGVTFLASEGVVPEELRMNDNFKFFSLDKSPEEWSEMIKKMKGLRRTEPEIIYKNFTEKGYEISTEAKRLERLLSE